MANGIKISLEQFKKAGEDGDVNSRRDLQREMLFQAIEDLAAKIDNLSSKYATKKDLTWLTWGFRSIYTTIIGFSFWAIKGLLK